VQVIFAVQAHKNLSFAAKIQNMRLTVANLLPLTLSLTDTIRAAWLQWPTSLGSRPRLAGSFESGL